MMSKKTDVLKLTVVGCSSGLPHPHLACSSYLIEQRRRRLLFDAGEGLSSALRRLAIDPTSIGTVFISHLHSDHWLGLPLFVQFNYLLKRKERLDIFLPAEGVAIVKRLLNQVYLFPEKLSFELEIHPVSQSLVFEMTDLVVSPLENSHLRFQKKVIDRIGATNKMQSYSFVVESGEAKIVYSSDIGSLTDLESVLSGTSLLVLDGNHIELTGLPAAAMQYGIAAILLTHLPEGLDLKPLEAEFRRIRTCELHRAHEGLVLTI
jgi:ribonuclease Z